MEVSVSDVGVSGIAIQPLTPLEWLIIIFVCGVSLFLIYREWRKKKEVSP